MSNQAILEGRDEEALSKEATRMRHSCFWYSSRSHGCMQAVCSLIITYPTKMRQASLIFLWLFPLFNMWYHQSWSMALVLVLSSIWTSRSLFLMHVARAKPLHPKTPEKVYEWFLMVHKISYAIFMSSIFMVLISPEHVWLMQFLYFGTLNSDLAVTISEKMSSTIGYLKYSVAPFNLCALCFDR